MLHVHAERIAPRLAEAWLGGSKLARRCITRLDLAYVDARYSAHCEITKQDLEWLVERIEKLQGIVADICAKRLFQGA